MFSNERERESSAEMGVELGVGCRYLLGGVGK